MAKDAFEILGEVVLAEFTGNVEYYRKHLPKALSPRQTSFAFVLGNQKGTKAWRELVHLDPENKTDHGKKAVQLLACLYHRPGVFSTYNFDQKDFRDQPGGIKIEGIGAIAAYGLDPHITEICLLMALERLKFVDRDFTIKAFKASGNLSNFRKLLKYIFSQEKKEQ